MYQAKTLARCNDKCHRSPQLGEIDGVWGPLEQGEGTVEDSTEAL